MNEQSAPSLPDIAFEQPLFHSERIAADWARMRSEITSTTQLESAYRALAPQVAELDLELDDSDAEQLLDLYNAAVADGRYIGDLVSDPEGVADKLKVQISERAAAAIKQAGSIQSLTSGRTAEVAVGPAIVVIAVVIVIVFGPKRPRRRRVVDSSGIVKI